MQAAGHLHVACVFLCLAISAASFHSELEARLDRVARNASATWNCSVSIAYRDTTGRAAAAAGFVNEVGDVVTPEDSFAWGSITKMLTGVSIMKLVEEGYITLDSKVPSLVDPLLASMADRDPTQSFRSLADLWGAENVTNMTVRGLLSMNSGVPDFDTATPCHTPHCVPKDPLRQALYAQPSKSFPPTKLMAVDWVAHKWAGQCKPFYPGMQPFCYSSTNFVLLGLILLQHQQGHGQVFSDLDQAAVLPEYLKKSLQFARAGAPSQYTRVHGFDRTSYDLPMGQHNNHDDINVSGVFTGWTASDVVAPASAVNDLTWEIYGPQPSIAAKEILDQMIPCDTCAYGLATFNLYGTNGQQGKYGHAHGHMGATYGYQSGAAYFPALNFAITVATNIERDNRVQPSYALCFAANAAAELLLNRTFNCKFAPGDYYSSGCTCDPIEAQDFPVMTMSKQSFFP